MANWKMTIDISDLWNKYSSDELEDNIKKFEEIRNGIVDILIKKSRNIERIFGEKIRLELDKIAYHLAQSNDLDDFDYYWNKLYTWADHNRVWLQTMK